MYIFFKWKITKLFNIRLFNILISYLLMIYNIELPALADGRRASQPDRTTSIRQKTTQNENTLPPARISTLPVRKNDAQTH